MDEIYNAFPKKTRYAGLEEVNMSGLDETDKQRLKKDYDSLLTMNYTQDEAIVEANLMADDIRQTAIVNEEYGRQRKISLANKEIERQLMGKPLPNLDGDVGLKRLKLFLKWLNEAITPDEKLIQEMSDSWQDVVDVPMTKYYSDIDGLRVYIIGGSGLNLSPDGFWYCTE